MSNKQVTEKRKGPQLEPYQVLLRPIITEKGTHLVERQNVYAFQVHADADKTQIKNAVESLFEVKVESVRTQNRKGKTRRYRVRKGRTSNWKKAYVKLADQDRISLF
jgi:large subunit ribosomal protein L23